MGKYVAWREKFISISADVLEVHDFTTPTI
jgi:hypothetical protein